MYKSTNPEKIKQVKHLETRTKGLFTIHLVLNYYSRYQYTVYVSPIDQSYSVRCPHNFNSIGKALEDLNTRPAIDYDTAYHE